MAQFNDTTNKNGLIQICEFWTRHADAGISGNATKLKIFTSRLNVAFERLMPILLAYNDQIKWDDINHTDKPTGKVNIVANQNDYKIETDDNSLDILNLIGVRAIYATGDTQYNDLERILANDERVPEILNPNTATTGQPRGFLELGNKLFLDVRPESSITNGLELVFQRQQSYFTSSDTTKEPGIPLPFHELLALHASLDWNITYRTDDTNLLRELKEKISNGEKSLKTFINLRNPSKTKMTMKKINYI